MSEPDIQNQAEEPTKAPEPTPALTGPSDEDAVLDRLLGSDDETSVPSPSEKQEPNAVNVLKPKATPEREKAESILRRDGVPQSVIDSVDDATLNEWVAKAVKRQGDVDGFMTKMKELEKKVAASSKTAEDLDDDVIIDDGESAEPSDDGEQSDSVNDEASDDGEPDGKSKSIKQMEKELAELRKAQEDFQQQALRYQADVADAALRDLYGEKAPEPAAVWAEMQKLNVAKPGSYQTMMQLVQEAYNNLVGPLNATARRKATQPTVANRNARSERPLSPADAEDAILDAIMDGKPPREARLLYRK